MVIENYRRYLVTPRTSVLSTESEDFFMVVRTQQENWEIWSSKDQNRYPIVSRRNSNRFSTFTLNKLPFAWLFVFIRRWKRKASLRLMSLHSMNFPQRIIRRLITILKRDKTRKTKNVDVQRILSKPSRRKFSAKDKENILSIVDYHWKKIFSERERGINDLNWSMWENIRHCPGRINEWKKREDERFVRWRVFHRRLSNRRFSRHFSCESLTRTDFRIDLTSIKSQLFTEVVESKFIFISFNCS